MTRPSCTFPQTESKLASIQVLLNNKSTLEKMATTKKSESDALFKLEQSECVAVPPSSSFPLLLPFRLPNTLRPSC